MVSLLVSLVTLLAVNFVDLGLGVKWADANVGAEVPEQCGNYYTWNEACGFGIPSYEEMSELMEKCQWHMETLNGCQGYRVTAENGNSIFLPCGGYMGGGKVISFNKWGYYWSHTVSDFGDGESLGIALSASGGYRWYSGPQDMRFPVREVSR